MIDLQFILVKKVDKSALFPMAALIQQFLRDKPYVGSVDIHKDRIVFTKGYFFTVGRIMYEPYQFVCRDGVVYHLGENNIAYEKCKWFSFLVSALDQLKPGYLIKI